VHAARRNIGVLTLCFNNGIYGMTGGQVAPTTPKGTITKTTPYGSLEYPLDLCSLAETAGASYVARWTTAHPKQLTRSIEKAFEKKGFAFIEAVTQCPTYFGRYTLETTRASDILRWFLRNSIGIEQAKKLTPTELAGKIIIGEFVDVQKPELAEQYQTQSKSKK
jgi:2-oxoglutarate ferredoxin oxidoreductase subunit beta